MMYKVCQSKENENVLLIYIYNKCNPKWRFQWSYVGCSRAYWVSMKSKMYNYKGFNINIIWNVLKMKLRLKDINQLLSWYELLTINKVNIVLIHNLKTKLTRCMYKITIVILHMEEGWKHIMCHNPSLRLTTKTKACKVAGREGSPWVKEKCEGMNPHTPKGASTLAVGVLVDSQIFKE